MTVETSASTTSAGSDEALIAELTPEMLAKFKADSRRQAIQEGFVLSMIGAFFIPNLHKQFAPSVSSLQPNEFADWFGLLVLLAMPGFIVGGPVKMVRGFIGRPALLNTELRYRRQHGKWRWER